MRDKKTGQKGGRANITAGKLIDTLKRTWGKEWRSQVPGQWVMGFLRRSLENLQIYVERGDAELNWSSPLAQLEYEINYHPQVASRFGVDEGPGLSPDDKKLLDEHPLTKEEVEKLIADIAERLTESYGLTLLDELTREVVIIREKGKSTLYAPKAIEAELASLPEDKRRARRKELVAGFTLADEPLGFKGKNHAGEPWVAELIFQVSPLRVDLDNNRAFYLVLIGLDFKKGDPAVWTDSDKTAFWSSVFSAIDNFAETLGKEEKTELKLPEPARVMSPGVVFPALKGKVKVSAHFLNAYFTTPDTIKGYLGQLSLPLAQGQDIEQTRQNLETVVTKGYTGINLEYWENRTMRGIFKLLERSGATEQKPFIILDNKAQLHEVTLERKKIRKRSKADEHTFRDFTRSEAEAVNKALEELAQKQQQVIIKGRDGTDRKGRPLYYFYMREAPLITVEYLKRNIQEAEAEGMTEAHLKDTAQIKITILPMLLRDLQNYFRMLPLDVAREIHEACPDVKKVTRPMVDFIDYLHRHTDPEVTRSRRVIVQVLGLEKEYKAQKNRTTQKILRFYEIAQRTGYLKGYRLDQKGSIELVDVFQLNEDKMYHLKIKATKGLAGEKGAARKLLESPKP